MLSARPLVLVRAVDCSGCVLELKLKETVTRGWTPASVLNTGSVACSTHNTSVIQSTITNSINIIITSQATCTRPHSSLRCCPTCTASAVSLWEPSRAPSLVSSWALLSFLFLQLLAPPRPNRSPLCLPDTPSHTFFVLYPRSAAQYDVLRAKGHSPSEAFNETVEEATQVSARPRWMGDAAVAVLLAGV